MPIYDLSCASSGQVVVISLLTYWPLGDSNEISDFKPVFVIDGWGISCEIALRWMSLGLTDDVSTLVQVMAWCHQATSHYLSQCWLRFMLPYGITGSQWVLKGLSVAVWQPNCWYYMDNESGNVIHPITQTPVSGSCCLPLGALQSMWATWCKI